MLGRFCNGGDAAARYCMRSGRLILAIGDGRGWSRTKRRDFQNDALIALTARRHGATVITANRSDFEILSRETGVAVLAL